MTTTTEPQVVNPFSVQETQNVEAATDEHGNEIKSPYSVYDAFTGVEITNTFHGNSGEMQTIDTPRETIEITLDDDELDPEVPSEGGSGDAPVSATVEASDAPGSVPGEATEAPSAPGPRAADIVAEDPASSFDAAMEQAVAVKPVEDPYAGLMMKPTS